MLPLLLLFPLAFANPLDTWSTRVGHALVVPQEARVLPQGETLVLADRGQGLVLQPAAGSDPVARALEEQVEPFRSAGVKVPAASEVACRVAGAAGSCRQIRLEVAPGATLHLLAGLSPDRTWTAVCLDRRATGATPAVCASVVEVSATP